MAELKDFKKKREINVKHTLPKYKSSVVFLRLWRLEFPTLQQLDNFQSHVLFKKLTFYLIQREMLKSESPTYKTFSKESFEKQFAPSTFKIRHLCKTHNPAN